VGASAPPAHELREWAGLRTVGRRHPGRWVAVAVILVCAAALVRAVVTNENFGWPTVRAYLTTEFILRGLFTTLELTALAMVIGIGLGVLLAMARFSANPILRSASQGYIWFFRGTPVLVQVLLLFNFAALYPRIGLTVPFGPTLVSADSNTVITAFVAAVVALGLNEAAYMAEIVRGGLLAVGDGQRHAAAAIGMTSGQTMRRIVLPQAMRIIVPPTGNEVIAMLKNTSIVSVIALPELLFSAQIIYSRTYQVIPLLMVACIWYLVLTSVLTLLQTRLEAHYARTTPARRGRLRRDRVAGEHR
jgi:polar amino acid transport system permease protein